MAEIKVNKIDAARRQVEAAIRLFFSNEDPVAIHTLVFAGLGILKDLAEIRSDANFHHEILGQFKPDKKKEILKFLNRVANFLKHADRDPDETLKDIKEEANDGFLLLACLYYKDIKKSLTPTMLVFCGWFTVLHPDLLKENETSMPMRKFLSMPDMENFRSWNRLRQLEFGKDFLMQQGLLVKQHI